MAYVWGRKPAWRFAGVLTARRGAALTVTSVAGSDQGVVAAGSARRYRVAFVSAHGRSWRRTAHLGKSSATAVTGVTAGPGGMVVAAGASHSGPFLLLAGAHRRPRRPGRHWPGRRPRASASTASARALAARSRWARLTGRPRSGRARRRPVVAGGGRDAAVLAGPGSRADRRRPRRRGLARGRRRGRPGRGGPGRRGWHPGLGHRPGQSAAGCHDLSGRTDLEPGRGRRDDGGAGRHPGRGRGGATGLRRGRCARRRRPADGRAVVVGRLTSWVPQGWWTGSARSGVPSALLAVTAGTSGFAAVGAVGTHPAVWLSRDGQGWQSRSLALPAGARSAVLQRVAIRGSRIAALACRPGHPGRCRSPPSRSTAAGPGGRPRSRCAAGRA